MNLRDVYRFFEAPTLTFLNKELTVCYVLSVLLKENCYGVGFIERLEIEHPSYQLSDTVLYESLKFLEKEKVISSYFQKLSGRGRPRRMFQIQPHMRTKAEELALLWWGYMNPGSYEGPDNADVKEA